MLRDARLTRSCGKKHCACKVNCSQNSYIVFNFNQTLSLGSGSASSGDWVRNVTRWELGTNGSAGLDTLLHATWEPNTKTYGLLLHWWVESTVPPQSVACLAKLAPTRPFTLCQHSHSLGHRCRLWPEDSQGLIRPQTTMVLVVVGPNFDDPSLFISLTTTIGMRQKNNYCICTQLIHLRELRFKT